jgi:hypothetical protein
MADIVPTAAPVVATPVTPAAAPAPVVDAPKTVSEEEYRKLRIDRDRIVKAKITKEREWLTKEKDYGEKAGRLAEYEKNHQNAKLNVPAYLQSLYGDNWYDTVVEAKLSGVSPANLMAGEIQKLREEMTEKLSAKDKAIERSQHESQTRAVDQARRQLSAEASSFYESNMNEYPIFAKFGDAKSIANTLAQRIEAEYHRSTQLDPETHEVLRDGRVMTVKEAADALENELVALAEEAASHEKYRGKLTAKLTPPKTPATVPSKSQQPLSEVAQKPQQRRTLSNQITGSTQEPKAKLSLNERRAKALAAFDAVRNARKP